MKKRIKWIIFLIIFVIVTLVTGAYLLGFLGTRSMNSSEISKEDKRCDVDEDCVRFSLTCGDCDCGESINIENWEKYAEKKEKLCPTLIRKTCMMYCPSENKCVEGYCELVPI